MITNWIGTVRHILVIVAIDLRDVEDLLIVIHVKVRESVGYDVVFTFDIFKFWAKLFEYYAPTHYTLYIKTFISQIFIISIDKNSICVHLRVLFSYLRPFYLSYEGLCVDCVTLIFLFFCRNNVRYPI